jgi:hypothetical protein
MEEKKHKLDTILKILLIVEKLVGLYALFFFISHRRGSNP